jgi:hypothetical protein
MKSRKPNSDGIQCIRNPLVSILTSIIKAEDRGNSHLLFQLRILRKCTRAISLLFSLGSTRRCVHTLWNLAPLILFIQEVLTSRPCLSHHLSPNLSPRGDRSLEGVGMCSSPLCHIVSDGCQFFSVLINRLSNIEAPSEMCNSKEQRALGNVQTGADTASGAEAKVVALGYIRLVC